MNFALSKTIFCVDGIFDFNDWSTHSERKDRSMEINRDREKEIGKKI